MKNHDIISNNISINKGKKRIKRGFVTNRKSSCYKLVQEKVLNWTSKGR